MNKVSNLINFILLTIIEKIKNKSVRIIICKEMKLIYRVLLNK